MKFSSKSENQIAELSDQAVTFKDKPSAITLSISSFNLHCHNEFAFDE